MEYSKIVKPYRTAKKSFVSFNQPNIKGDIKSRRVNVRSDPKDVLNASRMKVKQKNLM